MKRTLVVVLVLLFLECQMFSSASVMAQVQASAGKAQAHANRFPTYQLSVKLLPEQHRLEATGTLRLPAADSPRTELLFDLDQRMSNLRMEVLEPSACSGQVALEKQGNNQWAVRCAISANQSALLRFSYQGSGEIGPRYYLGPEGSFASGEGLAWYPRLANTLRATGELQISVPDGYTVIASSTSSTVPLKPTEGKSLFKIEQPTTFSFAAGKYQVHQRNGVVPVSLYLLEPRQDVSRYLDTSSKILAALVQEFGPYPYGKFALVEAPPAQAQEAGFGGVSMEGFILVSGESITAFNLALISHETAHQWWADSIKAKGSRGGQMLTEAMAQFGALRAVEALEGAAVAEQFRRGGYPGYEFFQNGLGYLMLAAGGFDHKLAELPGGWVSHELADSKGFLVWSMLSRIVGQERFRRMLRDLTQHYAFQDVVWDDFLRAVETRAGRDLKWFFAQWFDQPGAPEWQLTWKQETRTLRGTIVQSPPYYRAEVEVQVEANDYHRFVRIVEIHGPRTEFTWPVKSAVKSVTLDPHFQVLHWTPEYRAQSKALGPFTRAIVTAVQGKLAQAHRDLQAALEQIPEPDLFAVRFHIELGRANFLKEEGKLSEARKHLEAALASPSRRQELLPHAYYVLASLAKEMNDQTAVRQAVNSLVTVEAALGVRTGWADAARTLLSR